MKILMIIQEFLRKRYYYRFLEHWALQYLFLQAGFGVASAFADRVDNENYSYPDQ